MAKARLAVLLLLCCFGLWCVAQDAQDPITDPVDITADSSTTFTPDASIDATMASGSSYANQITLQYVNNQRNCGPRNCWIKTTPGQITLHSVGFDGYYLGVNGAALYHLPFANPSTGAQQAWVGWGAVGTGVIGLAVQNANTIYGLVGTTGCTSWPSTRRIALLNVAKTAWSTVGAGCLSQLAVAADGTLAGINRDASNAWYSTDGGATWVGLPYTTWTKMVPVSGNKGYGLSQGYLYSIDFQTGNLTFVGGDGTAVELTAGPSDLYIRDSHGIHYMDTANNYGTWKTMTGIGATNFAGSGYFMFALLSKQPYHFNALAPMITSRTYGSYNCNVFPNGCPVGSVHTATATAAWQDGGLSGSTAGYSVSTSGSPSSYLNVSTFDTDFECDTLYGAVVGLPQCQGIPIGRVICSIMGTILGGIFHIPAKPIQFSGTSYYKTAAAFQPGNGYSGSGTTTRGDYAACEEVVWCANTANPPGFQPMLKDYVLQTSCAPFYNCAAYWLDLPGITPIIYDRECGGTTNVAQKVDCTTHIP